MTLQIYIQFQKKALIYWPADDYNYTLSLPPKTKTSQNNDNNNTNLKAHNKQANSSKKHKSNKQKQAPCSRAFIFNQGIDQWMKRDVYSSLFNKI